ncbi:MULTISPECIES: putative polysaccharide biosynthesis protein [Rossellomorea]|uniref:putative polysaccharide biosynthesis protein n=1 Tax=Rossellomorea TaxID=2837508 RepID=UPI0021CCEBD3|nr:MULTISPECIES: polysaccharide biosynthesis protein [Rossellomorea]MDT9027766.1 polysaccharide biosynthesis protein [Rossellomorea sp. YC4-1]
MSKKYSSNQFLKGAMVLTVAALVTKILSAVYRVPFQNIVGDIGFYIYQQVYPFYGIAIALSTYGFPVIISKLVAEKIENEDEEGAKNVAVTSFMFLCLVGLSWFLIVYFGAGVISRWMGDPFLKPLIQVISLSFLLLAPLSVLRGYYQGKEDMVPTAVSQVTEQMVRVATILIFSTILVSQGYSLYIAGNGALFGSITGGLGGLLVLLLIVTARREKLFSLKSLRLSPDYLHIWSRLLMNGTAICVSAMLLVLLQFVDSLNVYSLLTSSGMEAESGKTWKGIYDRGQPFVQLGTVVATSISLTIVPLVTSAYLKKKENLIREYSQLSLKISITIGFAATLGIINIMVPTNTMLFENALGSKVIAVFCLSIFFSCLILTFSGIFQGIGKIYYPAFCILIGILLKYLGNAYLIPLMGIMGASISTVGSLAVITGMMILKLRRLFPIRFFPFSFYRTLVLSGAAMTIVLQVFLQMYDTLLDKGMPERELSVLFSLGGACIGAIIFVIVFLRGKVLSREEMGFLPFGSKWVRIMNIIQPMNKK